MSKKIKTLSVLSLLVLSSLSLISCAAPGEAGSSCDCDGGSKPVTTTTIDHGDHSH